MKRKRHSISKTNCEDFHFAKRCIERIGYVPDTKTIVKKIQNNELEFVERQSNRITLFKWIEPVSKISYKVVYDKQRKRLVTILFDEQEYFNLLSM